MTSPGRGCVVKATGFNLEALFRPTYTAEDVADLEEYINASPEPSYVAVLRWVRDDRDRLEEEMTLSGLEMGAICGIAATAPLDVAAAALAALACFVHSSIMGGPGGGGLTARLLEANLQRLGAAIRRPGLMAAADARLDGAVLRLCASLLSAPWESARGLDPVIAELKPAAGHCLRFAVEHFSEHGPTKLSWAALLAVLAADELTPDGGPLLVQLVAAAKARADAGEAAVDPENGLAEEVTWVQLLSSSLQALGAFAKLHRLPQPNAEGALEAVSTLVDCVAALDDSCSTTADEELQRSPTAVLVAALPAASVAARRAFVLRLSNSLERGQLPKLLRICTDGNAVLCGSTARLLLPARVAADVSAVNSKGGLGDILQDHDVAGQWRNSVAEALLSTVHAIRSYMQVHVDDAATVYSICYHLMAPAASAVQRAYSSPDPAEALADSSGLLTITAMTTMFTCNRAKLGAVLERAQAREGAQSVKNLMATFRTAAAVLGVVVKVVAEAAADAEKHRGCKLPSLLLQAACDNLIALILLVYLEEQAYVSTRTAASSRKREQWYEAASTVAQLTSQLHCSCAAARVVMQDAGMDAMLCSMVLHMVCGDSTAHGAFAGGRLHQMAASGLAPLQLVCATLASMLRGSEAQRERRRTGSDGGRTWPEVAIAARRMSEGQPQRVRLAMDRWLQGVDDALQGGQPQHRPGASNASRGGSGTAGAAPTRTQAQADAAMHALLAEEQAASGGGSAATPSKAALKRARKKAAQRQAATAGSAQHQPLAVCGQESDGGVSSTAAGPDASGQGGSSPGAAGDAASSQPAGRAAPTGDGSSAAVRDASGDEAAAAGAAMKQLANGADDPDASEAGALPDAWMICPLSKAVMADPVLLGDGYSYERSVIRKWLDTGNTVSPVTRVQLPHTNLVPNHTLRSLLQARV